MIEPTFTHLGRQLLQGGIAPQRVRRLLQELRDHHAGLLLEQQRAGLTGAAATKAALDQLGSEESLAKQLLARPELLSWSRRWPWAMYGLAPLLLLPAAYTAAICMTGALDNISNGMRHASPAPVPELMRTIRFFVLYLVPVLAAAGMALFSRRRGLSAAWAWLSITLFGLSGSFADIWVSAQHVEVGYGIPSRLNMLVPLLLDRWLPTAASAAALYAVALHWVRREDASMSARDDGTASD